MILDILVLLVGIVMFAIFQKLASPTEKHSERWYEVIRSILAGAAGGAFLYYATQNHNTAATISSLSTPVILGTGLISFGFMSFLLTRYSPIKKLDAKYLISLRQKGQKNSRLLTFYRKIQEIEKTFCLLKNS